MYLLSLHCTVLYICWAETVFSKLSPGTLTLKENSSPTCVNKGTFLQLTLPSLYQSWKIVTISQHIPNNAGAWSRQESQSGAVRERESLCDLCKYVRTHSCTIYALSFQVRRYCFRENEPSSSLQPAVVCSLLWWPQGTHYNSVPCLRRAVYAKLL